MTTAKKTATPRKRTAAKAVTASQAAVQSDVDETVYVHGSAVADGFVSNGKGPRLDRLTPRALENLTELATDGNTETARKHWTAVLESYGVKLNK